MNLPLYLRDDKGKGSSSLLLFISAIQSLTTEQMPFNAFSVVLHEPSSTHQQPSVRKSHGHLQLSRQNIHQ